MKHYYFFLILFFLTLVSQAQGISIQGIARDNASSAITDTNLTFTFSITEDDNTVLYAEEQSIKTDGFGLFSHVVRSGNPVTNTFDDIDFAIDDLKLKVSVTYNSEDIEVYNQTLQYTPYAHYARNGVPTGSILPFTGSDAPDGWVLCNGQSLTSIDGSGTLIALIGNNVPNLQGMFLRGTGTSPLGADHVGPGLLATQDDNNKAHTHGDGSYTAASAGSHSHTTYDYYWSDTGSTDAYGTPDGDGTGQRLSTSRTSASAGSHTHDITGVSGSSGTESRPVNFGVNYIIKL